MLIPNLELKDSYIIKNKLNYNVSYEDIYSAATYGILYLDYDLARKTQTQNAENFNPIILSGISLSSYTGLTMTHYDEEYTIKLDGYLQSEHLVNSNIINNSSYQRYTVNDSSSYSIGDYVEIHFYTKNVETGSSTWIHDGNGSIYYLSGLTSHNNQWEVTGVTTIGVITSGTSTWSVSEILPVFKYNVYVIETGSTYIDVYKKIEDYLYNNLMGNYINLYYNIINLNHCPKNLNDISNYLKKSIYGNYLKCNFMDTGTTLVINPFKNPFDIYFDFDNFKLIFNGSTTTIFNFTTQNLYNKYTLERFLDQFADNNISSGDTIYYNHSAVTWSSGYTNQYELDIYLNSINDLSYFKEYTFVNIYTDYGNTYKRLLGSISGTTLSIIQPNMIIGESIIKIDNYYLVKDISDILYGCYTNIEPYMTNYKNLNIEIRKKIYNSYYEIINNLDLNSVLREKLTGILFENINNVFVLKIYNPQDIKDPRLSYYPVESTILGKNKKTTIPFRIDTIRPIQFDVIDENIYSDFIFDENIDTDNVIVWDLEMKLTWDVSTTLVYGDPIPPASSNIPGVFKYNPSILTIGTNIVTATFYPTNKLTYKDSEPITNTFIVNKAPLYVSGNTTSKIYNTINPDFGVLYSGFVNGENSSVLITKPSVTCYAVTNSNVGSYNIIPSGGVSNNYDFYYYNGILTILKSTPRIVWNNPLPINTTTPLSSTQLNAEIYPADIANGATGDFTYNPDELSLLPEGTQTLTTLFTSSSGNWNNSTDSVNIVVIQL